MTSLIMGYSDSGAGKLMAAVADFPQRVVVVLAHTIKHLSAFSIADAFLETKFFNKFSTRAHMLLNGNTLTNLFVSFSWLFESSG
jgi:DNA mismatch repair protein MSH3